MNTSLVQLIGNWLSRPCKRIAAFFDLSILLVFFVCSPSQVAAAQSLDIAAVESNQDVSEYAQALHDADGQSSDEIEKRFAAEGKKLSDLLSGGYRDGYYWTRISLENKAKTTRSANLIISNRITSHVEWFLLKQDQAEGGANISRIQARTPTFMISIPPSQKVTVLLKLQFGLQDSMTLRMEPTDPDKLGKMDSLMQTISVFMGVIIAMLLFNFFLYFLTGEKVFILHVLATSFVAGNIFLMSGLSYYLLDADHWNKLVPVFGNYGVAFANLFLMSYFDTRKTHPRLHKLFCTGISIGIIGGTLFLLDVSKLVLYFTDLNLITIAASGMSAFFFFPPWKYRIMRFYLMGMFALGSMTMVWLGAEFGFLTRNFFTENAFNIGLSLEMIIVSLGLADQINHLKNKLEHYSKNLEQLVDEKTRDIRSIMEHIPLGIFMIGSDSKIHKDYSRSMRDIFGRGDLEACHAGEMIFSQSIMSSDDRSQAMSCIQASLGENVINFEANAHTLPHEIRRRELDGSEKVFDLTWNIIENSVGNIDKILVTMRDVTEIRKLQERTKDQQEELEFIGEILSVPTPRFLRFIQSCRELIQENSKLVHSQGFEMKNLEVLKLLFINMHTVKGSARSLYLKRMTQVFHDIEQYYAHLQKNQSASWDVAQMERDLSEANKIVTLYENIAKEKLGRSSDQTRFIEFRIDQVEMVYRELNEAIRGKSIPQEVLTGIDHVKVLFHHKIFKEAREVFEEIFGCLPVLAKDLNKELPRVILDTRGILVGQRADELLRNVFVHLLRNAMDHGIESAEERIKSGKNPQGTLQIEMMHQDSKIKISYSDNGRGLNIEKIRQIGLSRGLLSSEATENPEQIAELIFDSGLSTANRVTDISGRGVGMNAVRRFIKECGGDIRIILHHDQKISATFYPFTLMIELPTDLFEEWHHQESREVA